MEKPTSTILKESTTVPWYSMAQVVNNLTDTNVVDVAIKDREVDLVSLVLGELVNSVLSRLHSPMNIWDNDKVSNAKFEFVEEIAMQAASQAIEETAIKVSNDSSSISISHGSNIVNDESRVSLRGNRLEDLSEWRRDLFSKSKKHIKDLLSKVSHDS